MAVVLVLVLIVVGSVLFHLLSPWWWTPIASNWNYIDNTIIISFWITGIVFSAVVLFMAYCVFRFRHREGNRAAYEPENKRLESWLMIATAAGVTALLSEATDIEVIGQQWQWSFRLPGKDSKLGTSDTRIVSAENPLGIVPSDPNGQDDVVVEAADLHLPVSKPVKVLLRSIDVLHDFYIPEFRAKMDMIPGSVTYFWFTPTRTGTFQVLCAELCGQGHPLMHGVVVVDTEQDYLAWLGQQQTFAQLSAPKQTGSANQPSGKTMASGLDVAAKLETLEAR